MNHAMMKMAMTGQAAPARPSSRTGFGRRQQGATLIEVLVSIVILALGLLGVLGVQMRTLADTRTSVRREQAIRLIEDLSERLHANPDALDPKVLNQYVVDWWPTGQARDEAASDACDAGCAPVALAADQIRAWKHRVAENLPSGDARTFRASSTQLGVLVSWRENERSADADYVGPLQGAAAGDSANPDVQCPQGRTCHLQLISALARCISQVAAGAGGWRCSSGIAQFPPAEPKSADEP